MCFHNNSCSSQGCAITGNVAPACIVHLCQRITLSLNAMFNSQWDSVILCFLPLCAAHLVFYFRLSKGQKQIGVIAQRQKKKKNCGNSAVDVLTVCLWTSDGKGNLPRGLPVRGQVVSLGETPWQFRSMWWSRSRFGLFWYEGKFFC